MTTTTMTTTGPVTLADRLPLPSTRVTSAALVLGFALLTAASAQVSIHLSFTPVPITGQTFAVLLSGTALGMRRGIASQALYVAMGAVGLPFYADGAGGWTAATGSTAGYLVGFVVAAGVVGWLAERRQDRNVLTCVEAMVAGTAVMYLFGLVWLAHYLHVSGAKAVELGMTPFVIGDAIKALLAGALLPAMWRLTR
jgi:biotin transport system substrate-specific component